MAMKHADPGEVISLSHFGGDATRAIMKTSGLEVLRVCLAKGRPLPAHRVPGPITVQCLSGRIELSAAGAVREMGPGDWLYLEGGAEHSLSAIEDARVLVTIVLASGPG